MDVVGLYRHGFKAAVASLGTSFTREQAVLLKRYAHEIVLAYDADAAGRAATLRGLDILAGEGLEVRVAELPEGHDPDSLVGQEGLDAFRHLIDTSVPLVEYKMNEAIRGFDLGTVEGRTKASERLLPVLASIASPVAREGYVSQMAARLGVSVASLSEALADFLAKGSGERRIRSRQSASRHNLSRGRYTNRDLPGVPPGSRLQRKDPAGGRPVPTRGARGICCGVSSKIQAKPGLLKGTWVMSPSARQSIISSFGGSLHKGSRRLLANHC